MPYESLTIVANGANGLNNNIKQMLRLPCECFEWLRMLTNGLATYLWMMRMSYQLCHCLAIFLQMMRIFDDEAAIAINTERIWRRVHCFVEFKSLAAVVRHTQGMGNGERYKRLANALQTLQVLPTALPTLPMACECLQKMTANDDIRNIRWNLGDAS